MARSVVGLANTKKLVLWSVVLVQLGFIGCIWLLQNSSRSQPIQPQPGTELDLSRVHFVRQSRNARLIENQEQVQRSHCLHSENVNRYQEDFYQMKTDLLNRSADYAAPAYLDLELTPALWCYREGTLNETTHNERNSIDYLLAQPQCLCASGWHGRDCGQPEIIWRALMTHRRGASIEAPLKLREASSTSLKRLYYMLELGDWETINMELLELQLRTLIQVVDYFCIYYYVRERTDKAKDLTRRTLERQLDSMLITSYVLYQCESPSHCTSPAAYSYFRHQLWMACSMQMQPTDLLLFGNGETVYAPVALKFLKYFAADVLPLRFRLKHNVYGFYWQHPERTRLQGVIGSVVHMHGDPQRMERQQATSHTLGDLNHFGGWSCELCMPPEQIVHKLTANAIEGKTSLSVRLPNGTRSSRIDAAYVQQLMTAGMHLDGNTMLLRLRQQSEKYYAPETALTHSSQFGQLLVNLYDTDALDDVQEDED